MNPYSNHQVTPNIFLGGPQRSLSCTHKAVSAFVTWSTIITAFLLFLVMRPGDTPSLSLLLLPLSLQGPCWRRIPKLLVHSNAGSDSVLRHEEDHIPNFQPHFITWAQKQLRGLQSHYLAVSCWLWEPYFFNNSDTVLTLGKARI